MWLLNTAIYWSSLGVLTYTYAGYPMLVSLLAKLKEKKVRKRAIEPSVSMVMAVRDGESTIQQKIENLLALNYPSDKKQLIVVSDGSVDRTDDIIRSFADRKVVYERVETPSGKPNALNRGVARADGDIVVFCDVRQRIDGAALKVLTACFADPTVGAVSGELFIESDKGPGLYWKYEKWIRAAESKVDSVPGATGALYAIRRSLYEALPADLLLDDVFTPMQIIQKGYRVIFESNAQVFDTESNPDAEWRRKARTLAGNYQLLTTLPSLLNPRKNRILFQFGSHKLMRLVAPFALGGLLFSNIALVVTPALGRTFYSGSLAAQIAGYGAALSGALKKEKSGALSRAAYTFVLLNGAALEGARRFVMRDYAWTH